MNNTRTVTIGKHTLYTLLLLFFYVLQTTPSLLSIHRAEALWVVPVAIAIAMYEGEFVGGIYGAVAGLLCDTASVPRTSGGGSPLFGFNGFFIALFCIFAGLLVIYLLRCNLLSCLVIVAVCLLVRCSVEYLFSYGMWGHLGASKLYIYYQLPSVVYTVVVTPLAYWLIRWLHGKFAQAMKR